MIDMRTRSVHSFARPPRRAAGCLAVTMMLVVTAGCPPESTTPTRRVDQAWQSAEREPTPPAADPESVPLETPPPPTADETIIATANGRPVARRSVVELLLAGHGPGVLEQVIVLQEARELAAAQKLVVTAYDVDREFDRAIEQLAATLPDGDPEELKRQAGQAILADILSRRNISRAEFDMAMERNAYLRKIVSQRLVLTESQLRDEFDRVYGERVQARHIQVRSLGEAEEVRRRLAAGIPFAEVARQMSELPDTARSGGRLEPFTRTDQQVPSAMRDVAFALADGAVSNPVRIGDNYQIILREALIPAQDADFEHERDALAQRIRERAVGPAMQQLYRQLYERADITIYDPILRTAVEQRQGRREVPGDADRQP
jgi:parvulin-like peptidyl-prolyl isomerase